MWRTGILILTAGFAACAQISPGDAVKTEEAAVQIAEKGNETWANPENWKFYGGPVGWHARVIGDYWFVWYGPNYPHVTLGSCFGFQCYVKKQDGSRQCVVCTA